MGGQSTLLWMYVCGCMRVQGVVYSVYVVCVRGLKDKSLSIPKPLNLSQR